MNITTMLKSILSASGWSQETLAGRLGVSFVTLNSWVNGRSEPRRKAAESIQLLYFEIVGTDEVDTEQLVAAKAEVTRRKIRVQAITRDQAVLDRLTLHLTYHTNSIEGSTMTLSDTEEALFNDKVLTNRTQVEPIVDS